MPDWIGEAFRLLLGAASGGLVMAFIALRKERRENRKENREGIISADDGMRLLSDRNSGLYVRIADTEKMAEEAMKKATSTEALLHIIKPEFAHVVSWIDSGANPPPPYISEEARRALRD